ncbi:MAG: hypothetical protein ACLQFI_09845 [Methylocella sp.]
MIEPMSAIDKAAVFLRTFLADGAKPAKAVRQAAENASVSLITLRRAKGKMRIRPVKMADAWIWSLNEGDHQGDHGANEGDHSTSPPPHQGDHAHQGDHPEQGDHGAVSPTPLDLEQPDTLSVTWTLNEPPEPPTDRLAAIMADPILYDPYWFGMPIRPGGLTDDVWAGTLEREARCRRMRAHGTVADLESGATRPAYGLVRPKGGSDAEWNAAVADAKRLGYSPPHWPR